VVYRERALRVLLPIIIVLRALGMFRSYSSDTSLPTPFAPLWLSLAFFIVPVIFSIYSLVRQKVDWAGALFILHWYLIDLLSLPVEGYWYPGYQISIIIQAVLGALFLPSRAILPFIVFQLTTVGIWAHWLDVNYYDPLLLSTGEPVTSFWVTIPALAVQETIILLFVRYLRTQMEKSLHLQQTTILELQNEIEERHRLQEERETYIDELNKKNAELERFTYTISHDLKSPLVTIKGFLGLLKRDLEENKKNLIQKDFERIADATDKMGILLSELLELSRIGRIVNPPEEVDLVKLAQDTLETLEGQIQAHNITVTVSPDLPTVYMDRIRMREVMENLIDNAIKFMDNQKNPFLEIGRRESETETIVYIRDNGIGIEPRFHAKVFGLFEKLSVDSEGSGIGLAIVKRIIETYGGRIWVESEGAGKGSTFCFTIPNSKITKQD
jgi:signal transduction histidine kinase